LVSLLDQIGEGKFNQNDLTPWPMRPRIWSLIRKGWPDGDPEGRYARRRDAALAVMVACAAARQTTDWVHALFLDPTHGIGTWLQVDSKGSPRKAKDARRVFYRLWDTACEFVYANPTIRDRSSFAIAIARIEDSIDCMNPKGSGEATDKAVLMVHIQAARATGSLVHDASCRLVAEQAGVSRQTVSQSHRRLVQKGWLRHRGRNEYGSSRWELRRPLSELSRTDPICPAGGETSVHHGSDLWRWSNLGKTTFLYYADPRWTKRLPTSEFARMHGVTPRAALKQLRKLESMLMAERTPHGWVRIDHDLDLLAMSAGMQGDALQQRERHHRERQGWAQYIEDTRRRVKVQHTTGQTEPDRFVWFTDPDTGRKSVIHNVPFFTNPDRVSWRRRQAEIIRRRGHTPLILLRAVYDPNPDRVLSLAEAVAWFEMELGAVVVA
jgi:hypothetical protein